MSFIDSEDVEPAAAAYYQGGSGEKAEDGVSLVSLRDIQADVAFLESTVQQWLDDEWIPQDCHRHVAQVAAKAYVRSRDEGVTDLGQVLLNVGTELEDTDMGDAFVDAWTVANKVSDLLLVRMGREVCCDPPVFTGEQKALMTEGKFEAEILQEKRVMTLNEGPQLLNPQLPPEFFTMDALHQAVEHYLDEFNRFDFIRKFLDEGHETAWQEANLLMAIILGFRFDEWGNVDVNDLHERFTHLAYPPDFRDNPEMRERLEAILMEDEDEDKMKGLEEFLEVMVGKAYYHQMDGGDNPEFACRATLIKWLYEHDFVGEYANLPSVQSILAVKARIDAKNDENKPPPRYLY